MYKYLLLIFCFAACKKETKNDSVTIVSPQECVAIKRSSDNIRICVDSIYDARCPADVVCVWEGYVLAKLRIQINEKTHPVSMSTKSLTFPQTAVPDTTLDNHRFQLLNVLPRLVTTTNNQQQHIELKVD